MAGTHKQEPAVKFDPAFAALAAAAALALPAAALGGRARAQDPRFQPPASARPSIRSTSPSTASCCASRRSSPQPTTTTTRTPTPALLERHQVRAGAQLRHSTPTTRTPWPTSTACASSSPRPAGARWCRPTNASRSEDVDVYVCIEDDKVQGLAVIASEPREFTIVNIVGSIDIDKIAQARRTIRHPQA